jgi:hypothetical protein
MSNIGLIQFSPHSSVNAAREVVLQANLQEHFFWEEVLWKLISGECCTFKLLNLYILIP